MLVLLFHTCFDLIIHVLTYLLLTLKSYIECLWPDVWTDAVAEGDERLGETIKQSITIAHLLTLTNIVHTSTTIILLLAVFQWNLG